MKLVEITSQSRRDFRGIYKCEGCGHTETYSGYDDRNFHDNVTPMWECKKCGESTKTLDLLVVPVQTKYNEWESV